MKPRSCYYVALLFAVLGTLSPHFAFACEVPIEASKQTNPQDELEQVMNPLIRALQGVATEQSRLMGGEKDAAELSKKIAELYMKGNYKEALQLARQTLRNWEQRWGPDDRVVAVALNDLGRLYQVMGQYAKAEQCLQRALQINEQAATHIMPLEIATTLDNLGQLYLATGEYEKAEHYLQRALTQKKEVQDLPLTVVAITQNHLALVYLQTGQFAEAERLLLQSLREIEQALKQAEHEQRTGYSHSRSIVGKMEKMTRSLSRGSISEASLPSIRTDLAAMLNNLAELYRAKGAYDEAEKYLFRAQRTEEETHGPEHANLAITFNHLGLLYHDKGDYRQAESSYTQALEIWTDSFGQEHPQVATALNNLAILHQDKGDYARAEQYLEQAFVIREKLLGAEHPQFATTLNNLAELFRVQGDEDCAVQLYERALAIYQNALGSEHPQIAITLNNLAGLYRRRGEYAAAEEHLARVLAFREKTLGLEHPQVATTRNNLAELYRVQGKYDSAGELYHQALAIKEKTLGPHHPHVATILYNLAHLYQATGETAQAVAFMTRSSEIREQNLSLIVATGSEEQKRAYLATLADETQGILSLDANMAPHDPHARRLALTTILRRKGRVLDAMTDSVAILQRRLEPDEQDLLQELTAARTQLASLFFAGPGTAAPQEHNAKLVQLEQQVQRLEAKISQHSAEFRSQTQPVTIQQIQAALPPEGALVEFFVYRPPMHTSQAGTTVASSRYIAYILFKEGEAVRVDLGETPEVDQNITKFRDALGKHPGRSEQVQKIVEVEAIAQALEEQVMRSIRPLLGNRKLIFLSPEGALNLVPFAALVDQDGRYLVERYTFNYLTTGRDLLRFQTLYPSRQAPVILANPDFDDKGQDPGLQVAMAPTRSAPRRSFQFADFFTEPWGPLLGTAQEAAALRTQLALPAEQVLTEKNATEIALKQVQGPQILHIATHGFFLPHLFSTSQNSPDTQTGNHAPGADNPLLRSGLALAGANKLRNGQDDGILTALEVAGLDLWGTKLVVLSACETGLGDIQIGEGVYGLRRALVMAGAETQVMSLWKVSDAATRDLMIAYYQRLLAGYGRAEALREVQLLLLQGLSGQVHADPTRAAQVVSQGTATDPSPDDQAAHAPYAHPYYWASFIPLGAWTRLEGTPEQPVQPIPAQTESGPVAGLGTPDTKK